MSNIVWETLV